MKRALAVIALVILTIAALGDASVLIVLGHTAQAAIAFGIAATAATAAAAAAAPAARAIGTGMALAQAARPAPVTRERFDCPDHGLEPPQLIPPPPPAPGADPALGGTQ